MPKATLGSIAVDARDGVMLVLARWRYAGLKNHSHLPPAGLYEHLVGICNEPGAGGESSAAAVKQILQKACTVTQGRRGKDLVHGDNDVLDEALLAHVRDRAVCVCVCVSVSRSLNMLFADDSMCCQAKRKNISSPI